MRIYKYLGLVAKELPPIEIISDRAVFLEIEEAAPRRSNRHQIFVSRPGHVGGGTPLFPGGWLSQATAALWWI